MKCTPTHCCCVWTPSNPSKHSLTRPVTAGTEQSATAMTGMLYYLAKHPEINQKLKKEIRSAFKTPADINLQACSELQYLNACLEETLRIYPPIKIGFPRITPAQGTVIDGQFVPGGVCILAEIEETLLTRTRSSSTSLSSRRTFIPITGRTRKSSFPSGGTRLNTRRTRRVRASRSLAVRATALG
jgi:hypothetical protein